MKKVCWPYFDPEFDKLPESCSVCIDNESLEDCTVVKVDSINKQGVLLEVVQVLTDMNLTISKGFISSDARWFMNVFHVKDVHGNKLTDQSVIDYIQQTIGATSEVPKARACTNVEAELHKEPKAWTLFRDISGPRGPPLQYSGGPCMEPQCTLGLCVAYISDQSTDTPIDDHRLAAIEDHLTTVLRATTTSNPVGEFTSQQEVKTAGLPKGEGTTNMTNVERRLHQLMLSVRDFDKPTKPMGLPLMSFGSYVGEEGGKPTVSIESCREKGYSIVTVQCRDRPRLMFDTVCTIMDMQYVIFHASIDSQGGYAFQEYFIRHIDGRALSTEGEKERVMKCLEAAIERRVCEGVHVELCAKNRVGLLSDITRVLRENGLVVVRADVATHEGKAVNNFYVRDISGNDVDMEFIESMKREMGPIDLAVKNEKSPTPSPPDQRPKFSIGDILSSRIERLPHNFVAIK
ncbi:ACT-like superfamily protein [Actinidia rufa]|uniref:ACT domain-containing protein ACR n=1 Tax=Actinidia rufa TaxID=165716 RepID=A0A7J0FFF6_9ERIC|nr:ACT-like superfamily protein [Actinidia rufa]